MPEHEESDSYSSLDDREDIVIHETDQGDSMHVVVKHQGDRPIRAYACDCDARGCYKSGHSPFPPARDFRNEKEEKGKDEGYHPDL